MFTVTKFDRFARNMAEANEILTGLSGRGVLFGVGATIHDWSDPFGRLFPSTASSTDRKPPGRPMDHDLLCPWP